MSTEQFFDAVLPAQGRRVAGILSNGMFSNHFLSDNKMLVAAVSRIDAKRQDAYMAMGGFGPENTRTQANVVALRSFWLDIDTQEGKPKAVYASRKEAVQAVEAYRLAVGLPEPWLVSSGYGIHVYWPLDADIEPDIWQRTALLLKASAGLFGLDIDNSRTSDYASVLRPPGTRNWKDKTSPKPVKLLREGVISTHGELHYRWEQHAPAHAAAPAQRTRRTGTELNADLMMPPPEYPASYVDVIADNCAVMGKVRDVAGDVPQPLWYHALQLIGCTEEADEAIHRFSDGYKGYTASETEAVYARASQHGPTSCAKFHDHEPALCAGCPHFGKITSPITLGYIAPTPAPAAAPAAPLGVSMITAATARPTAQDYPKGYGWGVGPTWKGNKLWAEVSVPVVDDAGNTNYSTEYVPFCDMMVYPNTRLQTGDEIASMNLVAISQRGQVKEFELTHATVAEGGRSLAVALGEKEIMLSLKEQNEMQRYLKAWAGKLREEYDNTPTVRQFGWTDTGFVVGKRYIAEREVRKAIVGAEASLVASHLTIKGDLQPWVTALDQAYNHPGDEPLQFCVLLSFAAPLMSLIVEEGGVTVYAHSSGSGFGKTTALKAGLSAWGKPGALMLANKQFTDAALYQHFSAMNNLPVVVDELTNCTNEFAGQLVYSVADGHGRKRLKQTGAPMEALNWSTIAACSGNNLLSEKLSLNRANSEAEQSRLWEFSMRKRAHIQVNDAIDLFETFDKNYGHAGQLYAEYLVKNKAKVVEVLKGARKAFNTKAGLTQPERYWSMLHACVLTAHAITQKLGLQRFPRAALEDWIIVETLRQRTSMTHNVMTPMDQLAQMLGDLARGMIVSSGEGHIGQGSYATVLHHPKGDNITGRLIYGSKGGTHHVMYLSVQAVKTWANEQGVSLQDLHKELVDRGLADKDYQRISLGKGTAEYSGVAAGTKCLKINYQAMQSSNDAVRLADTIQGVINNAPSALQSPAAGTV